MKLLKTFFIRTYGCQMNELDSELIHSLLIQRGLEPAKHEDQADLVIFNTCSVRDLAERKVLGKIGIMLRKQKKPLIGIAGCMPMLKKEKLIQKIPQIGFLIGTDNLSNLNQVIDKALTQKEAVLQLDRKLGFFEYENLKRSNKISAYVSIIRGCNNFCSYCVVPYTRGREISRDFTKTVEECKKLKNLGYLEIVLLGQNVNSYFNQGKNFTDLLYAIDKIGIPRVRFLTSHPKDISYDLMQAIKDLKSVCEHLHLPLQSGSSCILKKMNRCYTKENYLEKVETLKSLVPDITLGTDIIVGFPTETEEDFSETLEVFQKVGFINAFLYNYSPRKNTPAYRLKDEITKNIKSQRLQKIFALFHQIQKANAQKQIGKTVQVLVERQNKEQGFLKGKTRDLKKVIFPAPVRLIGSFQKVKLEKFQHQTFLGKLIN